jgi:hypothetical protein
MLQLPTMSTLQVSCPSLQVHSLLAADLSHLCDGGVQSLSVKQRPSVTFKLADTPGTRMPPSCAVSPCTVHLSRRRLLPQLLVLHWPRAKHKPAARLPRLPGMAPSALILFATWAHLALLARLLRWQYKSHSSATRLALLTVACPMAKGWVAAMQSRHT